MINGWFIDWGFFLGDAPEPEPKKRKYEFRNRRIYQEALQMNDREFLGRFRVSKKAFHVLCDLIRDELPQGRSNNGRSLLPEERVLVFLFSAGTSISMFNAAYAHGMSEGTINNCINQVMKAIIKVVVPKYITLPTSEEAHAEAKLFQERGNFPPKPHEPIVIGAIDGSHILIPSPEDKKIETINRHGTHSLNVMILGGASFRIYAAVVNCMGAQHDASVFKNSELYELLTKHNYRPIPNCVILADQAYPDSEPTVCTCFPEGLATQCERMKAFNAAFILCRLVIEQIIGVLKRRFPTLRKGLEFLDIDRCSDFVQCCIG